MRGVIRWCIEATTPYKVCDAVGDGESAIRKAMKARCDVILLHPSTPLQEALVTVSLLRNKVPHVKIVGLSALWLGDQVSLASGFDAVIGQEDGLSKLVETPPKNPAADGGGWGLSASRATPWCVGC